MSVCMKGSLKDTFDWFIYFLIYIFVLIANVTWDNSVYMNQYTWHETNAHCDFISHILRYVLPHGVISKKDIFVPYYIESDVTLALCVCGLCHVHAYFYFFSCWKMPILVWKHWKTLILVLQRLLPFTLRSCHIKEIPTSLTQPLEYALQSAWIASWTSHIIALTSFNLFLVFMATRH